MRTNIGLLLSHIGKYLKKFSAYCVTLYNDRATWPYETLLLPKRHVLRFPDLSNDERNSRLNALKFRLLLSDSPL